MDRLEVNQILDLKFLLLHATACDGVPGCMAEFGGRLLVGIGPVRSIVVCGICLPKYGVGTSIVRSWEETTASEV